MWYGESSPQKVPSICIGSQVQICYIFFTVSHVKDTINIVLYISVLVLYQHDDLFGDFGIIIRNVLLFSPHELCKRYSLSGRLRWLQSGSVKFILFCMNSSLSLMKHV